MYKGYKQSFGDDPIPAAPGGSEWVEPPPAASYEAPKPKGSIIPHPDFNDAHIEETVKDLRAAMKGIGTDEHRIINVLTSHSNQQRQKLKSAYKTAFGRDLDDDLDSELSGSLLSCVRSLMVPARLYDAVCARAAMDGLGTNDNWMIELLCPRTAEELNQLKQAYKERYPDRDLEKDIHSETSGDYRRILLSSLAGSRESSESIDSQKAKRDANDLYQAGEGKLGTDEETFNRICAVRSWAQLKETAKEYKKLSGRELAESIDREFSFNSKRAFLAIVQFAVDPEKYYAGRIYAVLKGKDEDTASFIRLLVSRSEVDLEVLKSTYQKVYGSSLIKDTNKRFSGDFKKLVLKILDPKANYAC